MDKLKSRKLWITALAAAAQVLLPAFGIPPPVTEAILKLASLYIGVEGALDLASIMRQSKPGRTDLTNVPPP